MPLSLNLGLFPFPTIFAVCTCDMVSDDVPVPLVDLEWALGRLWLAFCYLGAALVPVWGWPALVPVPVCPW